MFKYKPELRDGEKDMRIYIIINLLISLICVILALGNIISFITRAVMKQDDSSISFATTLLFIAVSGFTIATIIAYLSMIKLRYSIYEEQILTISDLAAKHKKAEKVIIRQIKLMIKQQYIINHVYNETLNILVYIPPDNENNSMKQYFYGTDEIVAINPDDEEENAETPDGEIKANYAPSEEINHPQIPTKCPSCGASLDASKNGECGYCGANHGIFRSDE
ncbi:MAG: hypothetical protein LBF68_08335 [Christensenellaceae bacterium]|nr:hypothetical protein [Christensenellaceae bacterium]